MVTSRDDQATPPPEWPEVRPPKANAPPPVDEEPWYRSLAHYAGLVLASMLGCLIRLGLDALANYDGRSIFPLAWAQGVGCGIMGLALSRKDEITSIYPPLYTFITTGIAGSVTTFSSWMLESFLAFSNANQANRKGLHDTVDGVGYSLATWLISLGALHCSFHIASILPHLPSIDQKKQTDSIPLSRASDSPSSDPEKKTPKSRISSTPWLDALTILSAFLSYLIALILYFFAPRHWRHAATFPILLAPPGAILRFALSTINTRPAFKDKFPLGTFSVNIFASIIISATYVGQRLPTTGSTRCNALYAVQQGFCGCLSTVSTFVVESRTIKRKRDKWVYVGLSVVIGHLVVLAIVGGVRWSRGLVDVCGQISPTGNGSTVV